MRLDYLFPPALGVLTDFLLYKVLQTSIYYSKYQICTYPIIAQNETSSLSNISVVCVSQKTSGLGKSLNKAFNYSNFI